MELQNTKLDLMKRCGNQAQEEQIKRRRIGDTNKVDNLLNQQVVGNHLILKCIFSNLGIRDLQRMSRVCKLWNSIVEDVEYYRNHIHHLFFIFQAKSRKVQSELERSVDHFRLEHSFVGSQLQELKEYLQNSIKGLSSRPSFGFLFHGNFQYLTNKSDEILLHDLYLKLLPKDCDLVCVATTHGIIGTPEDYNNSIEVQAKVCKFAGISYLFLPPTAANVHIDTFSSTTHLQNYMEGKLFQDKKLKCLLLFSRTGGSVKSSIFRCVEDVLDIYENKLALGGIVCESVRDYSSACSNKPSSSMKQPESIHKLNGHRVAGVLFAGDGVNAASLVIKPHLVSDIEELIRKFRQSLDFDPDMNNSRKSTLGFLFVCYGRGFAMQEQVNIETDLINKYFPNIRLVGVFGSGEFGIEPQYRERDNYLISYEHAYSSILVLVQITKR